MVTSNPKLKAALHKAQYYCVHVVCFFFLRKKKKAAILDPLLSSASTKHACQKNFIFIFYMHAHHVQEQEHLFGHGEALSLEDARTDPERQLNFPQWLATSLLKPHV